MDERGSIKWPPTSPELTPLDILLGHLNSIVLKTQPDSLEELTEGLSKNIGLNTLQKINLYNCN